MIKVGQKYFYFITMHDGPQIRATNEYIQIEVIAESIESRPGGIIKRVRISPVLSRYNRYCPHVVLEGDLFSRLENTKNAIEEILDD